MSNSAIPKRGDHRLNVLHRSTLRGLKKCPQCGSFNGIRALKCLNKQCSHVLMLPLSKRSSTNLLNTVQLVSKTDAKLYSVQVREKDTEHHRSFVQITDKTISSDDESCIISRNAICYVDTCKYDSHDINISCKHIKNALENTDVSSTPLTIDIDIWFAMRLPSQTKARLWSEYVEAENSIPLVQRINRTMFVVKCDKTAAFPAGRLHVVLNSGASFSCACKKIKILMSPNNSIVLENDSCDHLYLIIAALLSNSDLKTEFHEHIKLCHCSIDQKPETLDDDCKLLTEDFIRFSEKILNDCVAMSNGNGINDNTPDMCAPSPSIHFDDSSNGIPLIQIPSPFLQLPTDIKPDHNLQTTFDHIQIVDEAMTDISQSLEFTDCQIELMDQFKLTDHIDLCNNEIPFEPVICEPILYDFDEAPDTTHQINQHTDTSPVLSLIPAYDTSLSDNNQEKPQPLQVKTLVRGSASSTKKSRHNSEDDDDLSCTASIQFDHWLSSVVERINLTMDFNDDGRPPKLVFSVCHGFFNTLRERFSVGLKRRLPSSTIVLHQGPYKGLTQYTWTFFSCSAICSIFANDSVPIELHRRFTKEPNKPYQYVEGDYADNDDASDDTERYRKIRPTMYKTYLKLRSNNTIRKTLKNADDLFNIEWIPNVLRRSKHGEMRLHFRFGHMKDNKIMKTTD